MKKLFFLLALCMGLKGYSCDVCNCGPGTSLMGFTPVKARWSLLSTTLWQRFRPIAADGNAVQSTFVQQNFGVLYRSSWGSVQLNLPFRRNETLDGTTTHTGLGDVVIGAGKNWPVADKHTLNTGLSAQLPTGKSGNFNWYQYPGMGNYRLLLSVNAAYQITEKSGWVGSYSYDPFLSSRNQLRVGASHNLGFGFWKTLPIGKSALTLMSGISAYNKQEDIIREFRQQFSGGRALLIDFQAVMSNRKFSGAIGGSLPAMHHINKGTVKPLPTLQLQVGYYIM